MKNAAFLIVIISGLLACNSTGTNTQPGIDTDSLALDGTVTDTLPKLDSVTQVPAIPVSIYKGLYAADKDMRTFYDCTHKDQVYWVEDESNHLALAYQKSRGNLSYPSESAYAEVKGYLKGKSSLGPAAKFSNVLVVTEVVSLTQKSLHTDCFDFEFLALGNEPFWALEIIPTEKLIALKDVAADRTYVFPYKKPLQLENKYHYEINSKNKDALKIEITKEPCNDGMSDRNYKYTAQIIINGKSLSGCAIKKGDKVK